MKLERIGLDIRKKILVTGMVTRRERWSEGAVKTSEIFLKTVLNK